MTAHKKDGETTTPAHDEVIVRLDALPLAALEAKAAAIHARLDADESELPGATAKTVDERDHSDGKFRDGEGEVLVGVLKVAPKYPEMVNRLLGAKDDGSNPRVFETTALEERLKRREIYAGLGAHFQKLADLCTDTALHYGEHTRPPILALYHLAVTLGQHDPEIHTLVASAEDFYGHAARLAAHTRAAKKHSGT